MKGWIFLNTKHIGFKLVYMLYIDIDICMSDKIVYIYILFIYLFIYFKKFTYRVCTKLYTYIQGSTSAIYSLSYMPWLSSCGRASHKDKFRHFVCRKKLAPCP